MARKSPPDAEGVLTIEEARRRLAVSRSTLNLLIRTGRLRSIRVGRFRRIEVEALRAFVEAQRVEPAGSLTHGGR